MKKSIYLVSILTIILNSCTDISKNLGFSKPAVSDLDTVMYSIPTQIAFRDSMVDLGNINEGTETKIVYHYQNIGQKPLMLFNVSPGCGCTIADFSHKPLLPGHSDSIVARFDSKEKEGKYIKNIKVNCNTEEKMHNIAFSVNVIKTK